MEMNLVGGRDKTDAELAEHLLDELRGVLARNGAALIHKPDCTVLAVAQADGWRAVAQVRKISCLGYDWRPITAVGPKPPGRQQ